MKPRIASIVAAGLVATTGLWLNAQTPRAPVASTASAPPAQALVDAAVAKAKVENKLVFVDFGASWCGPCRELHAFLEDAATRPIIEKYYVPVTLTVLELGPKIPLMNPGAEELMKAWGNTGGIPFWRFLDSAGKLLPRREWSRDAGLATTAVGMAEAERAVLNGYFERDSESAAAAPAGMADRWLWTVPSTVNSVDGGVSHDGRSVVFMDFRVSDGDLFLQDLKQRTQRRLTTTARVNDRPNRTAVFSHDLKRLAYGWMAGSGPAGRQHLRVMNLEGPADERRFLEQTDLATVTPRDWTPDGAAIVVDITRVDRSRQLGLVSVNSGDLRVLRALNASGTRRAFVSPDGRYLAFDETPSGAAGRDILVLAIDTGREFPAVVSGADDLLVGWSPDGDRIVFASDRSGTTGVWAVPFQPQGSGAPELMRRDETTLRPIGLTADGGLLHWASPGTTSGASNIRILDVNFANGQVAPAADVVAEFSGTSPQWSRDGKSIAYRTTRRGLDGREQRGVALRSVVTGTVREIWSDVTQVAGWGRDDRVVLLTMRGLAGVFAMDAATGEVAPITRSGTFRQMSPDGSRVYVDRTENPVGYVMRNDAIAIVEHDLVSGAERDVYTGPAQDARRLSPDGRTVYRQPLAGGAPPFDLVARDLRSGTERILVSGQARGPLLPSSDGRYLLSGRYLLVNTDGGPVRDLRFDQADWFGDVLAAPNGQSVLVNGGLGDDGPRGTFWVPLDGRPARRIGDYWDVSGAALHPNGRRLAVVEPPAAARADELWVLENLLRPSGAKTRLGPRD